MIQRAKPVAWQFYNRFYCPWVLFVGFIYLLGVYEEAVSGIREWAMLILLSGMHALLKKGFKFESFKAIKDSEILRSSSYRTGLTFLAYAATVSWRVSPPLYTLGFAMELLRTL